MRSAGQAFMAGALLLLAACGPGPAPAVTVSAPVAPKRIISLDYCADQFVLKLADRHQIAAVSVDAEREFSYMRASARGVDKVRSSAEDVIARRPDLVVRAYGGGPRAADFLQRAGVPVVQLAFAQDFEGVRASIRAVGQALGQTARAEAVIAQMDARLARAEISSAGGRALYLTPSGVTSGPGSLVDAMIKAAGLENFETQPGWRSVPLERLVRDQPDAVAAAFFNQRARHQDNWSTARHPVMNALLQSTPTAALEGAWTACGGWFLVEAVERLSRVRAEAQP